MNYLLGGVWGAICFWAASEIKYKTRAASWKVYTPMMIVMLIGCIPLTWLAEKLK